MVEDRGYIKPIIFYGIKLMHGTGERVYKTNQIIVLIGHMVEERE